MRFLGFASRAIHVKRPLESSQRLLAYLLYREVETDDTRMMTTDVCSRFLLERKRGKFVMLVLCLDGVDPVRPYGRILGIGDVLTRMEDLGQIRLSSSGGRERLG